MSEKSKYPRIEKSRYIYKNIPAALVKVNREWWIGGAILMFFAGFIIAILTGIFAEGQKVLYPFGMIIGLGCIISFFPLIYKINTTSAKIEFLDKLIKTAKESEILYLHDPCFDGLLSGQRIQLAAELTKSHNLEDYELLGDLALSKISLIYPPTVYANFSH